MALTLTLAACSTNEALNGPAGSDAPASLDDQIRLALSFIAQLRDGAAFPVGMIVQFPTATAPSGWVKANGALLNRTTYAALWAFAQTSGPVSEAAWVATNSGSFGVGDGSTTFRLPDYRGITPKGLDESRGFDSGRAAGTFQDHANLSHTHATSDGGHVHSIPDPGHAHGASAATDGYHVHSYSATGASTGAGAAAGGTPVYGLSAGVTDGAGSHTHAIVVAGAFTGITGTAGAVTGVSVVANGGTQNNVRNVAWPWYIKV